MQTSLQRQVAEVEELVRRFVGGVVTDGIDIAVLLDVLHQAGFPEVDAISTAIHEVEEMMDDQDGFGRYYPVNLNSGLVVLCQSAVIETATYWLDGIYLYINQHRKDDRGDLEKAVTDFIERSRPLKPIVLTEYGETL